MNKAELIDAIASKSGLSKADSKRALDSFVNTTASALKKGDRIALVGFGSFSISKRDARKGRNPQTGKEIKIPAKNVVRFKAGSDLSSKVKSAGPSGPYFVDSFFDVTFGLSMGWGPISEWSMPLLPAPKAGPR